MQPYAISSYFLIICKAFISLNVSIPVKSHYNKILLKVIMLNFSLNILKTSFSRFVSLTYHTIKWVV